MAVRDAAGNERVDAGGVVHPQVQVQQGGGGGRHLKLVRIRRVPRGKVELQEEQQVRGCEFFRCFCYVIV